MKDAQRKKKGNETSELSFCLQDIRDMEEQTEIYTQRTDKQNTRKFFVTVACRHYTLSMLLLLLGREFGTQYYKDATDNNGKRGRTIKERIKWFDEFRTYLSLADCNETFFLS